jgi:hypothetical protein
MSFRDSRQNRLYRNVYNKSTWNFLASTGTRSIGIGQGLKTVGAQAESGARAYMEIFSYVQQWQKIR